MGENPAVVTKAASREMLSVELEKRATVVKPREGNRRGMWEPIMGPEPTTKRGFGDNVEVEIFRRGILE